MGLSGRRLTRAPGVLFRDASSGTERHCGNIGIPAARAGIRIDIRVDCRTGSLHLSMVSSNKEIADTGTNSAAFAPIG
jgi:hypothetical protein